MFMFMKRKYEINIKYEFLPFVFWSQRRTQDKCLTEQICRWRRKKTWNWISVGLVQFCANMFHIPEFMCLIEWPQSKFWYILHRLSREMWVKLDLWSLRTGCYNVFMWPHRKSNVYIVVPNSFTPKWSEKCVYVLIDSKLLQLVLLTANGKYNHSLFFNHLYCVAEMQLANHGLTGSKTGVYFILQVPPVNTFQGTNWYIRVNTMRGARQKDVIWY